MSVQQSAKALRQFATLLLLAAALARADNVTVLTQHNDNHRTGDNLHETILNVSNVRPSTFGKLWAAQMVPGCRIGGQPLYVPTLSVPGKGTHNVVYVWTSCNNVLAFDADNGAKLWQKAFVVDPNLNFTISWVPSPPAR